MMLAKWGCYFTHNSIAPISLRIRQLWLKCPFHQYYRSLDLLILQLNNSYWTESLSISCRALDRQTDNPFCLSQVLCRCRQFWKIKLFQKILHLYLAIRKNSTQILYVGKSKNIAYFLQSAFSDSKYLIEG